ncbi:hypothetical protein U9M48_031676 [Paspalum notatum var. saurae]|uniref:Reverse transcriptase domain-containing protein n=1 Tax=Paspalum notatum var. saurae TaxID=547442 RepID=A0AAQ3X4M4_PASNO
MEADHKPTREPQRRLNNAMREIVKKEVIKLLHVGIIYPVSDSEWVSPVQVVPKKGGMTVVKNQNNELIPQRTVTGCRMCIDYRKLNAATRRMLFGLCNAPASFQRCMMAIFSDFIEDIMEVFMDDFSLYGKSFDGCLENLEKVLRRYKKLILS